MVFSIFLFLFLDGNLSFYMQYKEKTKQRNKQKIPQNNSKKQTNETQKGKWWWKQFVSEKWAHENEWHTAQKSPFPSSISTVCSSELGLSLWRSCLPFKFGVEPFVRSTWAALITAVIVWHHQQHGPQIRWMLWKSKKAFDRKVPSDRNRQRLLHLEE